MTETTKTPTPPSEPTTTEPATGAPARRPGFGRRALDAIDERMGIGALQYPVPEHANNLSWSLGALTAIAFFILLGSGVYISQWYVPMPEVANQSVREIMSQVWLGAFMRGLHFWASQAMFVLALLHMLRVFLHASYKRPREGNWVVGAIMLLLTFVAVFTGTVLKWDQEGFEALAHNLDVAELLGGLGVWFSADLASQVPIVLRLYTAHVVIIPGLIFALFVLHGLLVKRHKISAHPAIAHAELEEPAPFTDHIRRAGAYGLVLLGALSILSVLVPPILGPTPVEGIETTRPMWMFWWFFPLEQWFGIASVGAAIAALFGLIFLVPFLDRSARRRWQERKVSMGIAALLFLFLAGVSIFVWIYNANGH